MRLEWKQVRYYWGNLLAFCIDHGYQMIVQQSVEWIIVRGNRSTRRKFAPMPLCAPQIPNDLTRAAVMERRWIAVALSEQPIHLKGQHQSKLHIDGNSETKIQIHGSKKGLARSCISKYTLKMVCLILRFGEHNVPNEFKINTVCRTSAFTHHRCTPP
jgi:hypothetical protein